MKISRNMKLVGLLALVAGVALYQSRSATPRPAVNDEPPPMDDVGGTVQVVDVTDVDTGESSGPGDVFHTDP